MGGMLWRSVRVSRSAAEGGAMRPPIRMLYINVKPSIKRRIESIVKYRLAPYYLTPRVRRRLGWGCAWPRLASVECVRDARMIELNREFRGKNTATDVLSFPLHEHG